MNIKRYSECSDDEKLCLNDLAENYGLKVGNSFAGKGIKFTSIKGAWTNGDFDMYKVTEFCYADSLPCFIVNSGNHDFIIPMSEVTKIIGYTKPMPLFQVGDKVEASCKRLAYCQAAQPDDIRSFINSNYRDKKTIKEVKWSDAIHSYCYKIYEHGNWFAEKALKKVAVPAEAVPECKFKVGEQYVLNANTSVGLLKNDIITITKVEKKPLNSKTWDECAMYIIEYSSPKKNGAFSDVSPIATEKLNKLTPPIEKEKNDINYWKQFIGRYVKCANDYHNGITGKIKDVIKFSRSYFFILDSGPQPNVPGSDHEQCVLLPENYHPYDNPIIPESFIDKVSSVEPIVKQSEVYFNKQTDNTDKEVILYKQEKEVNFNFPEQQKELIFF